MFFAEGHVTPLELCKSIASLLAKGENPLEPMAWISYIIDLAGVRDLYGDAADDKMYCNISRGKLQNAYRYLTGLDISENALWEILTGPMGFSSKQCAKLEQVGIPHPQKDEQLARIDEVLKNYDRNKVLALSVDTKALVKLGRMKTPGGVFMCSAGTVVAASDHDFPFKLYEIYVERCGLFTQEEWDSWKNEVAVLRPVGVYCLNDCTAYIGLVLVKDTAESMCNTILRVIQDKKKTMPGLESVLLLADGGGANMANGIVWTNELKILADKVRLRIDACHYPPGSSKRNRIEHVLFGPLSRYWKNFPLLTIENVGTHICEMVECYPHIREIHVWLDKRHYKTRKEILKEGGPALTREMNDKRIISDYEQGSAMRKWNYFVLPSTLH